MERRAKLNHPEEHAPRVSIVSLDDRQFAHSVFKTIGQSSDAGQDLRRTIFQEISKLPRLQQLILDAVSRCPDLQRALVKELSRNDHIKGLLLVAAGANEKKNAQT